MTHWTKDYILWEISYASLLLLLTALPEIDDYKDKKEDENTLPPTPEVLAGFGINYEKTGGQK